VAVAAPVLVDRHRISDSQSIIAATLDPEANPAAPGG
jgi:hypothetical protein